MNRNRAQISLYAAMVLVAVVSIVAGYSLWQLMHNPPRPETRALIVLPESRDVSEFNLVDHNGRPFSLQDLRGAWSLLFFGFTHCPDICPSTLYDLKVVLERLQAEGGEGLAPHRVLFVSVDPERDTPGKLKQYVTYFHPDFTGLTGSDEALSPLTRELGIAYRIEPHEAGALSYQVDHSASILLTDPGGRLYGVFPAPHDADALAADLAAILD